MQNLIYATLGTHPGNHRKSLGGKALDLERPILIMSPWGALGEQCAVSVLICCFLAYFVDFVVHLMSSEAKGATRGTRRAAHRVDSSFTRHRMQNRKESMDGIAYMQFCRGVSAPS